MTDLVEDRIISEEYKIWKKNTPFMYDFMMTRAVEWPSPTVQWFPEVENFIEESKGTPYFAQRLLLGTNSQTEVNYLTIASVNLPAIVDRQQSDLYHMREDEFGAFSLFTDKYNYEMKIPHEGIVQTARYMPSNTDVIATKSDTDLFIFDISHCTEPEPTEEQAPIFDEELRDCEPIYEFTELNSAAELAWNPNKDAQLLTGFKTDQVAVWDIGRLSNGRRSSSAASSSRKTLKPTLKFSGHKEGAVVNDVAWHQLHPTIFGSATSEGELCLWDVRSTDTGRPSHRVAAHKFSVSCLQFSPFSESVLATASLDRSIALWDLRNLKVKLHSIRVREDTFHRIRWSPHYANLLGACNGDRRVYLFDLDRVFEEQTPDDAEEGPSTLLFSHNGHTSPIYDMAWNPKEELMVCSVSEDNIVQCWQVISKFLSTSK